MASETTARPPLPRSHARVRFRRCASPKMARILATRKKWLLPRRSIHDGGIGPHGFTAVSFAFTSCFADNGQSYATLSANTWFYNFATVLAMPALAFAALFGRQRNTPSSSGTLPTHAFVFGLLLTITLIITVALSYLPALALGPVLERLLLGSAPR
jgi:K+-transporting ATPase A subunit